LTKELTKRFVADLSSLHVGTYAWPELKNFRLHVVPSIITGETDAKVEAFPLARVGDVPKLPSNAAKAAEVTATWPKSYTHPSISETPPMSVDATQASAWTAPSATAARRRAAAFSRAAAKKAGGAAATSSSSSSSSSDKKGDEGDDDDNEVEDVDGEWLAEDDTKVDEPLVMPEMREFTENDITDADVAAAASGSSSGGNTAGGGGKKRKEPTAGGKKKATPKENNNNGRGGKGGRGGGGGNNNGRGGRGGRGGGGIGALKKSKKK
jgi:hypothetical protein